MMDLLSWDKLQVKQKIISFGVSIFLVTYLVYSFLLVPKWTSIDELKAQNNIEQQQVKIVENFLMAHPSPETYLLELDNKITDVNQMLPDNPDVSNFLLQVEELAAQSGLQLSYLKPGKIDNKQGYREIIIDFSVKGDFSGIMNFLHKTENLPRFVSITTISMQLGTNGLESKMLAKIYSHGVTVPAATPNNPIQNKK